MMGVVLLGVVLAAAAVALQDWRRGLYALVAVAMLVDPLRKMAPGAPSYMMLATAPVRARPRVWISAAPRRY
jgi:hypothetical protein